MVYIPATAHTFGILYLFPTQESPAQLPMREAGLMGLHMVCQNWMSETLSSCGQNGNVCVCDSGHLRMWQALHFLAGLQNYLGCNSGVDARDEARDLTLLFMSHM